MVMIVLCSKKSITFFLPELGGDKLLVFESDSAWQRSLQQQGWSLHAAQAEAQCCLLGWTAAEHLAEQRREETVAANEAASAGIRRGTQAPCGQSGSCLSTTASFFRL
jgi:hypothetical protein